MIVTMSNQSNSMTYTFILYLAHPRIYPYQLSTICFVYTYYDVCFT